MNNIFGKGYRFIKWELHKLFTRRLNPAPVFGRVFRKPLTVYSSRWLKYTMEKYPQSSDEIFMQEGILPVADHYYQPLINPKKHLTKSLRDDRGLPALDLNVAEQLSLLGTFHYNEELLKFPLHKKEERRYYYENGWYTAGDAEFLYNMIRHYKPHRIIEIGSGYSTLMAVAALQQNNAEDGSIAEHFCIEPHEQPWLEQTGVTVIRKQVETLDQSFFLQLEANDILFIDSSHMIRPQGDVLFEYLEILPILKAGVIVHVHDIFTPKDYPEEWIYQKHLLWNEQYLLEAFLSFNSAFRVIGSLNYLAHHHKQALDDKCPVFATQAGKEPGAFWFIKN